MPTIAVLASGQGTNFEALAQAARRAELGGRLAVLLSDRSDAGALERARRHGIAAETLDPGPYRTRLEDESIWLDALRRHGVDTVLLAGFMRRLHAPILTAFADRILNIHPSLLPAFPGRDAIRQAWEHGVRVTGCTVHLVDAGLDSGVILAQTAVEIRDDDQLASIETRVHEAEHRLYPATVARFLAGAGHRVGSRWIWDPMVEGGTHA